MKHKSVEVRLDRDAGFRYPLFYLIFTLKLEVVQPADIFKFVALREEVDYYKRGVVLTGASAHGTPVFFMISVIADQCIFFNTEL